MVARKFFPKENGDTSAIIKVDDLNRLIGVKSKQINIVGVKSIDENTISVYNDIGLKAAELFNDKLQYTCEIAIPLKLLALPAGQPFSYQIKVNGPAPVSPPKVNGAGAPPPPPVMNTSLSPTDFWGEYTLAKKDHE